MKKLILSVLMIFLLASCVEDLGQPLNPNIKAFVDEHYGGARILSAEYDDKGLFEVEIRHKSIIKDVYFNYENEWVYTSWDVRSTDIPAIVKSVVDRMYPGYRIEDADYIQRSSGDYYVLELEKGEFEADVTITVEGEVISPSTILPVLAAEIKAFVSAKYPAAIVVDYGYDSAGVFGVIVQDGNIEKYLFFDGVGTWMYTRWHVSVDYLPDAVNTAIAVNYPNHFVDSSCFVETPTYEYYEIELELGETELLVRIAPDGSILS